MNLKILLTILSFHTCTSKFIKLGNLTIEKFKVRGVNLGGWMILEPWITPSLFYQFLGKKLPSEIAMDSLTFCKALGPVEANRQLRYHWSQWITQSDIQNLKSFGIDTVKIPVGDWIYQSYGYFNGCYDGAYLQIFTLINLLELYDMNFIISLSGVKGSQNGFDRSGNSNFIKWVNLGLNNNDVTTFIHWYNREANWIGNWSVSENRYSDINYENIDNTLKIIKTIVNTYKNRKGFFGIEVISEPWENTPINILQRFYIDAYNIVYQESKDVFTIFHDSFRSDIKLWIPFVEKLNKFNRPLKIIFNTNIYQAWNIPMTNDELFGRICGLSDNINQFKHIGLPVMVGGWSLAFDNCQMWLNGFQDNLPGYPMGVCDYTDCPNNNELFIDGMNGPFGTGFSFPANGQCPVGRKIENNNYVMTDIAAKSINVFENSGFGWIFNNFKTEFGDRWNFLNAVENEWIGSSNKRINIDPYQRIVKSSCSNNLDFSLRKPVSMTTVEFIFSVFVFIFVGIFIGQFLICIPKPQCRFRRLYRNNGSNNFRDLPFSNYNSIELESISEE